MRFLSFASLLLLPMIATAQATPHPQIRQGFGISFGVGAGSAGASCNSCTSERDNGFSGYLRLGGYLKPNILLGVESNGWVHSEEGVDETLGFYTVVTQWYPNTQGGLYLKGGLGLATYGATDGTDDLNATSGAVSLGAGYDFRVGRNFSLTPFANFLKSMEGEIKANDISTGVNIAANVFQLGLGFTWH